MSKPILFTILATSIVLLFASFNTVATPFNFITVKDKQFIKNNKPYIFMGTNMWNAVHLAVADTNKLIKELNSLQNLGITNIRLMALFEEPNTEPYRVVPAYNNKGILNETYLKGLDFVLNEMNKRNINAVICLSNFWHWSGGLAQYLQWVNAIDSIHYPNKKGNSWDVFMKQTARFYSNKKANALYIKSIEQILNRTNTISQIAYKKDATIMAWEICNEPRGINNRDAYIRWIKQVSGYIKQQDANHLVTTGSEGITPYEHYSSTAFERIHAIKTIDYVVAHIWPENWNWYNPLQHQQTFGNAMQQAKDYLYNHVEVSKQLNKPFVLEEFGLGRDSGSFNSTTPTTIRDSFYAFMFEEVRNHIYNGNASGVNFWAWSGSTIPTNEGGVWVSGNTLTGDPPHETQGWYSVYTADTSTCTIIKKFAKKIASTPIQINK